MYMRQSAVGLGAPGVLRRRFGRRRRGVGMYPDETCFDSSRPSWLPYWLDDFSETACKGNELLFGNQTGNTAQPGTPGAASQTIANAQAACSSSGGTWDAAANTCGGLTYSILQYAPWIVGGLAAFVVLQTIGGRR